MTYKFYTHILQKMIAHLAIYIHGYYQLNKIC